MKNKSLNWLAGKLVVARWILRERLSRGMVAEALLKAPVQLALLVRQARLVTSEPDRAVEELASGDSLKPIEQGDSTYPSQFNINPYTEDLLRGLVLRFMPRRLVETGVANGVSTRVILAAIDEVSNLHDEPEADRGVLHSLDISTSVVSPDLAAHRNWKFHLVDEHTNFREIMRAIGEIDFFFHDSNHAYWNQLIEYRTAWKHLSPGGLLVSDDINWSQAFLHFCEEKRLNPVVLADGPKFVGVVRKPIREVSSDISD